MVKADNCSIRIKALTVGVAILGATSLPVGTAQAAEATAAGCPSEKWIVSAFPLNWEPGDPTDPSGDNLLLQIGIAGLIEEFGSVEAGLEAFGFETFEEFYAAAVDPAFNKIDQNNDGLLCVKPFPEQGQGQPAYNANAIDNHAAPR
jgi:hypothetical protein